MIFLKFFQNKTINYFNFETEANSTTKSFRLFCSWTIQYQLIVFPANKFQNFINIHVFLFDLLKIVQDFLVESFGNRWKIKVVFRIFIRENTPNSNMRQYQ